MNFFGLKSLLLCHRHGYYFEIFSVILWFLLIIVNYYCFTIMITILINVTTILPSITIVSVYEKYLAVSTQFIVTIMISIMNKLLLERLFNMKNFTNCACTI